MGGAARNDKQRRQAEAQARLRAAGISVPQKKKSSTPLIVVVVVLVVAVLIGGFVLYARNRSTTPAAAVSPSYTTTASGAVVTAGKGKAVIDVYEDFLCPNCERFEARDGAAITAALNAGTLTVRYHAIAILDRNTTPVGYSTRAANAALCAAAANVFPAYHAALFAQQPAEGSAGLTDQQLAALAPAGTSADFATCVTSGRNAAAVTAETQKAVSDPNLQTQGQFGTPTVAANGTKVNLNDSNWLKAITG